MLGVIFNNHYNENRDERPDKKHKQWETFHCLVTLPMHKNLGAHIFSLQAVIIHNATAQQPARNEYAPITFISQAYISVQNVSVVPKTISQH